MGQPKISLKELASVQRKTTESIDDYLNRFKLLKRLQAEKARASKYSGKKEKVAYVDTNDNNQDFDIDWSPVEESEVNIAELQPRPPFVCKMLRPSNGNNPEEPKNDRFVSKTYTFDVTKCDEIFDLLVNEGIMIVPNEGGKNTRRGVGG